MRLLFKAAQIMTALACVITSVVVTAPAAQAIYYYRPTHPMNERVGHHIYCTGGFGIRTHGNNAPYFLTAGHCFNDGQSVWGTDGQFGITWDSRFNSGSDTAAVAPLSNTDGLQEIPGLGRVVGKMSDTYSTTPGNAIAFQGRTSGRQYGTVTGWIQDLGTWLACANFVGQGGDSGGPVFTHDANGRVYAAGIIVLRTGAHTCFMTIDNLLAQWNAWLPVFSAASARSSTTLPDAGLAADSSGPAGEPLQGLVERNRLGG